MQRNKNEMYRVWYDKFYSQKKIKQHSEMRIEKIHGE